MKFGGKIRACASIFLLFSMMSACAVPHENSAEWEQTVQAKARIVSIDIDARRVKIRHGFRSMTVRMTKSAKGFELLRVGGKLDLVYFRAVVVAMAPVGANRQAEITKYHLAGATETKPAIAYAKARQFTAEFLDFDYQSSIATFRKPDDTYPILIVPLGLRPFVRTLTPGDRIAVSIEEALTVSIAPNR